MTRRDTLKVGAVIGAAALVPVCASAGTRSQVVVFDGRSDIARAWSANRNGAFDCSADAAALWFAKLGARLPAGCDLEGMTGAADRMILEDLARREGFRLVRSTDVPFSTNLQHWVLSRRRAT